MFKSTIYDEVFESLGFFNTREEYRKIEHNYNPLQFISSKKSINENTAIGYFPGCFATFHDGHVSVIKKALQELKKISNDYLLVIAPVIFRNFSRRVFTSSRNCMGATRISIKDKVSILFSCESFRLI